MVRQAHHPEPSRRANPMTKNTNPKQRFLLDLSDYQVSVIEISYFEFTWNLVLVYWYFAIKCKKRTIERLMLA